MHRFVAQRLDDQRQETSNRGQIDIGAAVQDDVEIYLHVLHETEKLLWGDFRVEGVVSLS